MQLESFVSIVKTCSTNAFISVLNETGCPAPPIHPPGQAMTSIDHNGSAISNTLSSFMCIGKTMYNSNFYVDTCNSVFCLPDTISTTDFSEVYIFERCSAFFSTISQYASRHATVTKNYSGSGFEPQGKSNDSVSSEARFKPIS
jgi:hypothetical protein